MNISVRWEKSSACKTWTHGYVGDLRWFTIEAEPQMPVLLLRHLPGPNGHQSPLTCTSLQDAKQQADVEAAEHLKHTLSVAIE